jgi:hypothetical protein
MEGDNDPPMMPIQMDIHASDPGQPSIGERTG